MRAMLEVPDGKVGFHLQMKSGAIAISESRRSMRLNFELEIQLGVAAQRFPQDLRLQA